MPPLRRSTWRCTISPHQQALPRCRSQLVVRNRQRRSHDERRCLLSQWLVCSSAYLDILGLRAAVVLRQRTHVALHIRQSAPQGKCVSVVPAQQRLRIWPPQQFRCSPLTPWVHQLQWTTRLVVLLPAVHSGAAAVNSMPQMVVSLAVWRFSRLSKLQHWFRIKRCMQAEG